MDEILHHLESLNYCNSINSIIGVIKGNTRTSDCDSRGLASLCLREFRRL